MSNKTTIDYVRSQILALRATPKVNVLNPEHIDLYAQSLLERISGVENENYIAKWCYCTTLRKHLLTNPINLVRAVDVIDSHRNPDLFPVDADKLQPWAVEALERNELHVWVLPIAEEVEKQRHWMDFLATLPNRQIKYTVTDLLAAVRKWDVAMWKSGSGKDVLTGCEPVENETLSDTKYVMVKLLTEKAYKNEGSAMSHCVSTYWKRKESTIYSLRDTSVDPENCRVATIEVKQNALAQIKGFDDATVPADIRELILAWAAEMGVAPKLARAARDWDEEDEDDEEWDEDEDEDEDDEEEDDYVPPHRRQRRVADTDEEEDDEDF